MPLVSQAWKGWRMTYAGNNVAEKIRAVRILTLGGLSFLQQVQVWKYSTRVLESIHFKGDVLFSTMHKYWLTV